jgi:hypothetical protein
VPFQNLKIDGIHHETHKNGGSSIKDSQDRMEKVLNEDVLPRLGALTDDIEAFRTAKTMTTVEVTSQKE